MRVFRLLLLLVVLPSAVFASGATIKLSGNTDPAACPISDICITNDSFDILTNSGGGGYFNAFNQQDENITGLLFDLDYVDPTCTPGGTATPVSLQLDPTFYLQYATTGLSVSSDQSCTSQAGVGEYQLDLFFTPGIATASVFSIDLNSDGSTDPNGTGGWIPSTDSPVQTTIPEPGTLAAGASGLLLLGFGLYRRSRREANTAV